MHHAYPSSQRAKHSAGLRAPRHRHRLILDTARHQGQNGPTPSWTHNNLLKPWLLLTVLILKNTVVLNTSEDMRNNRLCVCLSCLMIIVPLHLILIKLFCGANKMFLQGCLMYFHLFILLWISLTILFRSYICPAPLFWLVLFIVNDFKQFTFLYIEESGASCPTGSIFHYWKSVPVSTHF